MKHDAAEMDNLGSRLSDGGRMGMKSGAGDAKHDVDVTLGGTQTNWTGLKATQAC